MAVVDREPRPNVARTLLAALRDDWQLPVKERNRKPGTETLIPITEEMRLVPSPAHRDWQVSEDRQVMAFASVIPVSEYH
jgi:hypothetical protein